MGLLQAADLGGGVLVGPSVTVLAGLRGPEVHAPRHCHCRISIAGREFIRGFGTHQRTDIVHRIVDIILLCIGAAGGRCRSAGDNGKKSEFYHNLLVFKHFNEVSANYGTSLEASVIRLVREYPV